MLLVIEQKESNNIIKIIRFRSSEGWTYDYFNGIESFLLIWVLWSSRFDISPFGVFYAKVYVLMVILRLKALDFVVMGGRKVACNLTHFAFSNFGDCFLTNCLSI